ncbi:MAG TPA: hypothetical protein VFT87_05200 [Candidatus Saccharimonadales bacterium]|nr:hypothetical protein [Candidatus Saccharimonadales bacterium]
MINKYWRRILLFIILFTLLCGGVYIFTKMHMSFTTIDADNPPQFIQSNVVDLNKVTMISKFRSGAGHDHSNGSSETCRSMKHYFYNVGPGERLLPKEQLADPIEGKDRTIMSPVNGKIDRIERGDRRLNDEITVIADSQPDIRIRLQHVTPLTNIKEERVTAGQLIGVAGQSFDVVLERLIFPTMKTQYISYFAAMPDELFTEYQLNGVKNRDELIITRAQRDAQPLRCGKDERFIRDPSTSFNEDFVYLRGSTTPN